MALLTREGFCIVFKPSSSSPIRIRLAIPTPRPSSSCTRHTSCYPTTSSARPGKSLRSFFHGFSNSRRLRTRSRAPTRAITDINFSAHHPDVLATCGVDSFVFVHDLRSSPAPLEFADFTAGATQVKWNHQNGKIIIASTCSRERLLAPPLWD
jgi:WD40 repeat protein